MDSAEDSTRTPQGGREWMCPNCGDEVDAGEVCGPWDCVYCGETMVPKDKTDVTPNDRLRALINEWRAVEADSDMERAIKEKRASQRLECADELEELIQDGK